MRRLALVALLLAGAAFPASAQAALHPIHHVFVIVLENESATTTFGSHSPAPYLSQTLRAEGAYLPHYYGVGHESNDNYIAMISGQAPNILNQTDCLLFVDNPSSPSGPYGQAPGLGCVYSPKVPTIASQLEAKGLTWRDYNQSMGADPLREPSVCGHPALGTLDGTQRATATDEYATRHNPFVYFQSIIDNTTLCDTHVVNLDALPNDLANASDTPNYVFITPDLCNDGHDAPCANGQPGGLRQADSFLRQWVPRITGSPAFRDQNGLLAITFDEGSTTDTSSCCGEIAGPGSPLPGLLGPGGGDTGAVLLSRCIAPGTVSQKPYNHYTLLRSVEDLFGMGHIGYAGLPGAQSLGSDVFTATCVKPPKTTLRIHASVQGLRVHLSWSVSGGAVKYFVLQVSVGPGRWRTLLAKTQLYMAAGTTYPGAHYQFRLRAATVAGGFTPWVTTTVVVPAKR